MEIKDVLKKYCADIEENIDDFNPTYKPEEELEIIKSAGLKRKMSGRRKIYVSMGSAAAVVAAVCAAVLYNSAATGGNNIAKNEPSVTEAPVHDKYNKKEENSVKQPESNSEDNAAKSEKQTNESAESKMKNEIEENKNEPMLTYPPKITAPPYYSAAVGIEKELPTAELPPVEQHIPREEPLSYELEGTKPSSKMQIKIQENEDIPSGSSMHAGAGDSIGDGGELWSEERYFEYLGINPLDGMKLPEDMIKEPAEKRFVMLNPDGTLYNDRRTFTFANVDRTRLISVTASRGPLSPQTGETNINGVMVSLFDNHMSTTALLDAENVHILIEGYGITEEELKAAVYSCAEVIG